MPARISKSGGCSRRTSGPRTRLAIEAAAEALAALPMPTIAAVRGFALAGGAELAIACDLRVAAEDATFGFPEVKIGIFPGAGGALRLPRLVGGGAARDLLFTGRHITAEEAFRLGLVDRLVPADSVLEAAAALAASIAVNAPLAVRAVKRALEESHGTPLDEARRAVNALRAALDARPTTKKVWRRSRRGAHRALPAADPLSCRDECSYAVRIDRIPRIPSTFAAVATIAPSAISSSEGSVIAVAPLPT